MKFSARIMSGLLAFVMFHSPAFGFGGNNEAENNKADGKTVTVTVAHDGSGDCATLEEARDYVRTLDKTKYSGIDVVVGAGEYNLSETFLLTAEDSGTENCPVRYIGENGAHLYGGVAFTAADFEPLGDGEVVQYFPEEVKDKLVQIDLKKLGFKAEDARDIANSLSSYPKNPTFLYCDGEKMSIARFPNETENVIDGWARIKHGHIETDEESGTCGVKDNRSVLTLIEFDEAYNERVHSWHDIYDGFVKGRLTFLWAADDTSVACLDPEKPLMKLFKGGYEPREGMVFFWYHIPEELDIPGEYYVDSDCILYYYPTDAHETAVYTMPTLNDNIITLDNVQYLTIDNLSIEASRRDGISGGGEHITVQNSTVQGVNACGIRLHGSNITIQNNTLNNLGQSGIAITGGDEATLTHADNLVTNNYISGWSAVRGVMESGVRASGCGITVSHNEICHSVDWGIGFSGVDILVEYNHLYDLGRFEGDGAAIHITESFGTAMRYNYIHDIGFDDDTIDFVGVGGFNLDYTLGDVEIYGNIVENITGNGVLICGGRSTRIHDNLFIGCRRNAVHYDDRYVNEFNTGMRGGKLSYDEYILSAPYIERFEHLADLLTDGDEGDLDDPNFWINPAYSVIKNNFVYIDKANLADPSKLGRVYLYWDANAKFSEIVEPTSDEVVIFSSKRTAYPTAEEALEKAAGTINLPYEEFLKIGIEK